MTDEEETIEKKEWPTGSEEELTTADAPGIPKPVEKQEECDPMTMNCNEMPKAMAELTKRSEILGTGLRKLEEINEVIPSTEGKQLFTKTTDEKSKVDGKIQDIVLRFSRCTLSEEKEEEPPENPES